MIESNKNPTKISLFTLGQAMQAFFNKLGLWIMVTLVLIQVLHYCHIFREVISSIHSLTVNPKIKSSPITSCGIFCFIYYVMDHQEIIIGINESPKKTNSEKPIIVSISPAKKLLVLDSKLLYNGSI